MTEIPAIAADSHAWDKISAGNDGTSRRISDNDFGPTGNQVQSVFDVTGPIDDQIARAVASWWMQAPNGHAGTFTALAFGKNVAKKEIFAAIDSEYETALPDMQAAFDNLRAWAK